VSPRFLTPDNNLLGHFFNSKVIAKDLRSTDPGNPRIAQCLETYDDTQLPPRPQALSTLVRSVHQRILARVNLGCEGFGWGVEDGDEHGVAAEREGDAGEPYVCSIWCENGGGGGHGDGYDGCGVITFGEVGQQGCPGRRRDQRELGGEGGEEVLFRRGGNEDVGVQGK
jgi:hypothetical protein